MPETLTPGTLVGSYEVVDRLGKGGMGEVYKARDTRLGRTVALKVLRADADGDLLRRLDREARAASALNHPNIVHIYDVGVAADEAGVHYVVMEHVEGETLRRRLAAGPLPLGTLLDLGGQLADGLAKAHRAGIVHRDLKPENVMVTPEGLLKILDFGLAKRLFTPFADLDGRETLTRHDTQAGALLGTLEYMSPEQANGRDVDHRTDQFAFGLILHEMATGRPVFRRETAAQVLAAVLEKEAEPLARLRPDLPAALGALVARCLQKDRGQRYATTDEVAVALKDLARRPGASASTAPAGAQPSASVPPLPSLPRAPISAEIVRPLPPLPVRRGPALYHVQTKDRVRRYDEEELAKKLRDGKLTGLELVRQDGEDEWRPLFESRIYTREVPTVGDPRNAARLRALRGAGGHLLGFVITAIVMVSTQGQFPFWLWIWGAVLAAQLLGTVPAALALWPRSAPAAPPAAPPPLPVAPPPLPAPAPLALPSAAAQEGARVRALLEQRGGADTPRLLAEVDRILKLTADLAAREADLAEQTSEREREAVAAAVAQAQARLERADLDQDRRLYERQLEVMRGREEAIVKAARVLERLSVRREMAEHQLKQLRLDLSRGAAGGLDVPELSSRLEFIRYEVDAREEVEGLGLKA